jgi:hypothetical protein
MKKLNIIAISTFLILMFSLTSCQKKWIDPTINQDPNAITDAPVSTLLPAIEANMGFVLGGNDVVGITSMWDQYSYGSANQSAIIGGYNIKPSDVTNLWAALYEQSGMLGTKIMIEKAGSGAAPHYEGIGQILMAVYLGNTVDLFGNVPYSQAFQGASDLTPKYDNAKDLYDTVQTLLTNAISNLSAAPTGTDGSLGSSDYIFGGSASEWIKVAWGLKMRYTLHLSNVSSSWATDIINMVENDPMMTSNDDNMAIPFGTSQISANPLYLFGQSRTGYISNNNGFFKSLTADTMQVVASKDDSAYLGVHPGETTYTGDPRTVVYEASSNVSWAGEYYSSINSPTVFMSYPEEMFIAAEAYQANGDNTNAMKYLKAGITASFDQFKGIDKAYDALVDGWVAKKMATITGTVTKAQIMMAKYNALYMQAETYNDYRRTGIPALTPYNSKGIPDRYPYSQDEYNYNEKNVPLPAGSLYTKLFWAK